MLSLLCVGVVTGGGEGLRVDFGMTGNLMILK